MKDLGLNDVILGIKTVKHFEGITLTQSHNVEKVLKKFNQYNYIMLEHLMMQVII